jgi:RND family efflux transporter MFP subunit
MPSVDPADRCGGLNARARRAAVLGIFAVFAASFAPAPLSIRAETIARLPAGREVRLLRGVVKPLHQAAYSTDQAAPVAVLHRREGETFAANDLLISFDCGRQRQELAAARALEREAEVVVQSNTYLLQRGSANRNDTEIAKARRDKAAADAAGLLERMKACEIVAPFDGSVVELSINPHEFPVPGRPFLVIASHRDVEIEIIVPSALLPSLRPLQSVDFAVDETRRSHRAEIKHVGAVVDPMSQTAKVYARFASREESIRPGMSGTATFPSDTGR